MRFRQPLEPPVLRLALATQPEPLHSPFQSFTSLLLALALRPPPLFENHPAELTPASASPSSAETARGKSSLLKVIAGDSAARRRDRVAVTRRPRVPTRSGCAARRHPHRLREVAVGARRARRPRRRLTIKPRARSGRRARRTPEGARRLGDLQHELEEQDGWSLEQKSRAHRDPVVYLPADRPVGELSGGWRRARSSGRRWWRSRTCSCSTSRRTISISMRSPGWRSTWSRFSPARCSSSPTTARSSTPCHADRGARSGTLTSWPGSYPTYLQKKAEALENEARDLGRLDKKLAQEEAWLRQGVKARRTRNEGRVKDADGAARRARRAPAHPGNVRLAIDRRPLR